MSDDTLTPEQRELLQRIEQIRRRLVAPAERAQEAFRKFARAVAQAQRRRRL